MSQKERTIEFHRKTDLPARNFHLMKHHYVPIRYEPGVEVIRRPTIEHKIITSGNVLTGERGNHGMHIGGPRQRQTIQINRSEPVLYADVGGYPVGKTKKVVKVVGGGEFGDGINTVQSYVTSSAFEQPQSFVNMQRSMENELERRRTDWEGEVQKMQNSFFDMKTSDASKSKLCDADFKIRHGGQILTVGDSHKLFHELPDGTKVYRQKFDLYGFDTEDLSVRAENGKLTISASREEDYDGAKSMKKFTRTVDIPDAVDQDQISSFIGDDGILTIEAPLIPGKMVDDRSISQSRTTRITETPGFSSRMRVDDSFPEEFDTVVKTTTKTTSNSNTTSPVSAISRTRYLGPDVEDTPHGRKLKTSLYIGRKYKAEDITVKLYDYKVNVDAKSEDIIGGRTSKRQFARDVDIPGPVERSTFKAVFGTDGRLYIGGSFSGNDDHTAVAQSVLDDMPPDGREVNVMY